MNTRVLLIWDRMGDYHRARWRALQTHWGEHNVFAADLGKSDVLYKWSDTEKNTNHYTLSDKQVEERDIIKRVKNFYNILRINRIDVIAQSGYGKAEYILFMFLAKLMGKRIILFAESWYEGNHWSDKVKGLFLSWFADAFFVSGLRAKKHFTGRLGIAETRIMTGYSAIDNEHFSNGFKRDNSSKGAQHKSHFSVAPVELQPYILCVARYSEEKNLEFLIEAYRKSTAYKTWNLVLIGDGPQKEQLQQQIDEDSSHILLANWKGYEELPFWYQNAEALVLPSKFEPWGLVVNEAMAARLPVMTSAQCGCVDDLISERNRFTFDAEDQGQLVACLNYLHQISDIEKKKIGDTNFSRIQKYNVDLWAENLIKLF